MVDFVKNTCEKLYGKSKVYVDKIQGMGGEDYAYISLKVPSCMYRVTVDKDSHAHNCKFKINGKDYFPTAMESLITCTIDFLKNQ
jgi:metal-dependent amidase/aminoacylase/carboxypeptidase family protein